MNVGIIGLGRAGEAHVHAYRAHGIAIGAVVGSTYARTVQRAEALGLSAAVCHSVDALLARDDIDLVSICSPPEWHHAHVMATARAGKDMIVEKPIVLSARELEETTTAVRESGVRTGVSFVLRWLEGIQQAYAARHHVGRIFQVQADFWNGQHHQKPQSRRELGTVRGSISTLLSSGCHAVDMACWFVGAPVTTVQAVCPGDQAHTVQRTSTLLLQFANGSTGVVTSTDEVFRPLAFRLCVNGTEGGMDVDLDDERVRLYARHGQDRYAQIAILSAASARTVAELPFTAMIGAFVDALRRGSDTAVTFAYAAHIHRVCFAAEDSARQHGASIPGFFAQSDEKVYFRRSRS